MNYGIDKTNKVTNDILNLKKNLFDKVNSEYCENLEAFKQKFEISYKTLVNSVNYKSNQVN